MTARLIRLLRIEVRKLRARRLTLAALILVAAVALLAPWGRGVLDTAAALARGDAPQADSWANGWTALCGAVKASRLVVVLVVLVLSASCVAEETSAGTLQALLARPVRRLEILLAKALAVWGYAVLLLAVAVGAAALGAELTAGLYDVVDPIHPVPSRYTFGEMADYVLLASAMTALALGALTSLGLACSVLLDHPGHATGLAVGAFLIASAATGVEQDLGQWLFVHTLSAPFDVVGNIAEQYTGFVGRMKLAPVLKALATSAAWATVLTAAAAAVLQRRDITGRD